MKKIILFLFLSCSLGVVENDDEKNIDFEYNIQDYLKSKIQSNNYSYDI